jgi:thioester reductase-like protein
VNCFKSSKPSKEPGGYTLLTGATGLVGRYLIKDLLLAGKRMVLLVRDSEKLNAQERVEQILQCWEKELSISLPRPVVMVGDVKKEDFGLNEVDLQWLTVNCTQVIHSAASLTFIGSDRSAEPWSTNYDGSKYFVDLAKKINVRDWHYVSTAYVCGKRDGTIYEDELDCGQAFRNDYEHSKLLAEKFIREQAEGFAKLTVYRPAVIVGDSETGYTSSYHGLFLYLRLIATLVPQQPRDENGVVQTQITLPINGDEPRNLVTVDWVSKVICRVVTTPEAHGKTFHLSPEKSTTARQIIDFCYEYFNSSGVEYAGSGGLMDEEELSSFATMFFANSRLYEPYQSDDPEFDRTQLLDVAGDIPCPPIDRELIFKFIRFGELDRWGKRKVKPPVVPVWFNRRLEKLSNFSVAGAAEHTHIGIDIQGPGGGQWQIEIDGDQSRILRGLPVKPAMVMTVNSRDLFSESENEEANDRDFWLKVLATSMSISSVPFPTISKT